MRRLSLDLDQERRLEGVQVHASGLRSDRPRGGLSGYLPARRERCRAETTS